ncbi:hypothetical protein [Cellulomonas sp. URHD0024]|uniref:hypothetical protein n=1 Tax=Cellulomonas sp. URHD0024 TaxID=1302620 RepID=UPI0003F6E0B6|nr:hypothetical protein [Cellulomonas sp. URHD0024]
MSVNPLVAAPVDTSTTFGGAGLLDSVSGLCDALQSTSWVSAGLAGVGVALDTVAAVVDPLGSLISAGLGWLIEHLQPLKGWLNDLTGDAGAVLGFAGTWGNVADAMGAAGNELTRVVRADLEAMSGESISAYSAYADALADRIRVTGSSAASIGSALKVCAMIVQAVHDLVRDTLSQLVGSIISWAAEAVFTLGLATPVIVGQVSTRVSSLATRIGRSVTDVITSAKSLRGLLDALKGALTRLSHGVRSKLPGHAEAPGAPTPRVADAPTERVGDPSVHDPVDVDDLTNKQKSELFDIPNPQQGMTVWRVYGEAQDGVGGLERGSRPFGESWTPTDPRTSTDFRWEAGLPDENPGRFLIEGILRRPSHVDDVRPALPLDGNPGGWPEYLIRDAEHAVEPRFVGGVNEAWTRQPGDWVPD